MSIIGEMWEEEYFQLQKEYKELSDKIMAWRDKLPFEGREEYDKHFNIGTPTEKIKRLFDGTS